MEESFMNPTQSPFVAEGILILTAGIFGILLDRAKKPYGKVKLVIHLFFASWFAVGFGFVLYGLFTMNATKIIWIPVALIGFAILTQLVTGILMLASTREGKAFPNVHLFSAIVMVVSDICAFFIAGVR
jgi:hypothetical protein